MAFLGLIGKKDGLKNKKADEVKKDLREVERLEAELIRRASTLRGRKASKEGYVVCEPYLTDDELDQIAVDVDELDNDIAATNDELSRVRDEKRAIKGILILIERKERLKRIGIWDAITKMKPEQLEESLRSLGDVDASVSGSVDEIRHILGTPPTPQEMRQRMTPSARRKLDELKANRDANAAQRTVSAPPDGQRDRISPPPAGNGPTTTTISASNGNGGEFWVYEDDVTNRARVHRSDCGHCRPDGERLPNNRWHGPYPTREDAFEIERRLGKGDSGGCGTCRP